MVPKARLETLVLEMQNDFLDTPGLLLTPADAERRFGADRTACAAVLDVLADAGVLARTPDGSYLRVLPRTRSAGYRTAAAVAESAA